MNTHSSLLLNILQGSAMARKPPSATLGSIFKNPSVAACVASLLIAGSPGCAADEPAAGECERHRDCRRSQVCDEGTCTERADAGGDSPGSAGDFDASNRPLDTMSSATESAATPTECQDADGLWCERSERCIPPVLRCNGIPDCEDGSDEAGDCSAVCESQPERFWCEADSRCLFSLFEVCNGREDCSDGSDEPEDCGERCESQFERFWCEADSRCLFSLIEVCNGIRDCSDGSDEPEDCKDRCEADGFGLWCEADSQCLSMFDECNGIRDCSDGSDEPEDCKDRCEADQGGFWCADNSGCLFAFDECNGVEECADGSDEHEGCSAICEDAGDTWCAADSVCIFSLLVCDGTADCTDGSDEPDECRDLCLSEEYRVWCAADGTCLWEAEICDGTADCSDGSDEPDDCGERCESEGDRFWCASDSTCLRASFDLCDGFQDCSDGSDESSTACVCTKGEQVCSDDVLESCRYDEAAGTTYWDSMTCEFLCSPELGCMQCTPGESACGVDGPTLFAGENTPALCNPQGRWEALDECMNQACIDGQCSGECEPGTASCSGLEATVCSADGEWSEPETCDWGCIANGCDDDLEACTSECIQQTCDAFGFCSCTAYIRTCGPRQCTQPEDCGTLGFCDASGSVSVCRPL